VTITFDHKPGEVEPVIRFFRRETDRLRSLTKVIISPDETVVQDINRDAMEFVGLTFNDPALEALLTDLEVVYDLEVLMAAGAEGRTVEYPLSARYPWAWERVSG
jgi:hypothetical protein